MKLLSLYIKDPEGFRSLKEGFKIDFYNKESKESPYGFDPYCFVGRNGSGKSNVLEALANIFYHIECIYLENKPDDFEEDINGKPGFKQEVCYPDAFELEYMVPAIWNMIRKDKTWGDVNATWDDLSFAHIKISKELKGFPKIEIVNNEIFKDINKDVDRTTIETVLPELVVGYSSGENETLSLPFFKMRFLQFDEYKTLLKKREPYGEPSGRMVYLDSQYTQAILLSNFLMQEEKYLAPFKNEEIGIGIEEVVQFRLIIRQHHKERFSEEILESIKFTVDDIHEDDFDMVELTSNIEKSIIDKLKACATTQLYDRNSDSLFLDYCITQEKDDQTKKAFQFHFNKNPLELFRAFQTLLFLNLYQVDDDSKREVYNSDSLYVGETIPILPSHERIFRIKDLWIRKKGVEDEILSKSLSDGEHQFIHSMGICMLLRDTKSLFLLDEPETHFNPEWRAKFITILKNSLGESDSITRDILITTHSPFIISDCHKEKVKWFKKGEEQLPEIEMTTFGSSSDEITDYFFEYKEMIPQRPLREIEAIEKEIEQKVETGNKEFDTLINRLKKLGESSDKFMLLNYIAQLIEEKE